MKCRSVLAAAMLAPLSVALVGQQPKGSQSAVDAIHKLVHAGRFAEVETTANTIPADDPEWKHLLDILVEAAEQRNDYRYLEKKAQEILSQGNDANTRATGAFALGIGRWRSGQLNDAVKAFSEATRIKPGSELAYNAQGNIHEIQDLAIGQPVPQFAVEASSGAKLTLKDLRGKTVLLNFWASW